MASLSLLVELVLDVDRTGLTARGCPVDELPTHTAYIDFVAPPPGGPIEGGKFHPEHDQIDIYREGRPATPTGMPSEVAAASPAPARELVWLAHELGHLASKLRGHPQPLTPWDDVPSTYREELRAWRYARTLLVERGFQDWETFAELQATGLASYQGLLDVSPEQVHLLELEVSQEK
jgi:hypothetical protein